MQNNAYWTRRAHDGANIPINKDPNDLSKMVLNIVEGEDGVTARIPLSKLNSEKVLEAGRKAQQLHAEKVKSGEAMPVSTGGELASEQMRILAQDLQQDIMEEPAGNPARVVETDDFPNSTSSPGVFEVPTQPAPAGPRSPLAAFNTQPAATPQRETKRVTFELENFGTMTAKYSDVIVLDGFIVLVVNTAQLDSAFLPQPAKSPSAPPVGMYIDNDQYAYLVLPTDIRFEYGGNNFCILLIQDQTKVS